MQSVASEMNLSETAFVWPAATASECTFHIRWFTPAVEVPLCGHATLAAAHVLWSASASVARDKTIRFVTRERGDLVCRASGDFISMEFPVTKLTSTDPPPGLADALGIEPIAVTLADTDLLVEVAGRGRRACRTATLRSASGPVAPLLYDHGTWRKRTIRLCIALFRTLRRDRRGSRHRQRTLRTSPLLGSKAREEFNGGLSGIAARR